MDVESHGQINYLNFAVNERSYDVTAPLSFDYATDADTITCVTSMGKPLFQENRCIGKALYALPLESSPNDPFTLSGINISRINPVELMIK